MTINPVNITRIQRSLDVLAATDSDDPATVAASLQVLGLGSIRIDGRLASPETDAVAIVQSVDQFITMMANRFPML